MALSVSRSNEINAPNPVKNDITPEIIIIHFTETARYFIFDAALNAETGNYFPPAG
jgi:hypothetical protein